MNVTVKVVSVKLDNAVAKLPGVPAKIVRDGAANLMSYAKAVCPVDTGFLRSSITMSMSGNTATVLAAAGYALFVEMGTHKMSAQPYLIPASEQVPWDRIIRANLRAIGL